MAALKDSRHEAFARHLAEGRAIGQAYVLAGYKDSPASATRLSKNVKVVERVAELKAAAAKASVSTIDDCTKRLKAAYLLALKTNSPSAAVSAVMGEARLNGLIVDRKEVTGANGGPLQTMPLDPEQLKDMTDAELAVLEKALGKLGSGSADGAAGTGAEAG